MMAHCRAVVIVCLASACGSARAQQDLAATFEQQFGAAQQNRGASYREARDAVVAMGEPAIPLLEAKLRDDRWSVRMTAGICLGWLRYPEDYAVWRAVIDGERLPPGWSEDWRSAEDPLRPLQSVMADPKFVPLLHEAVWKLPPAAPRVLSYEERQGLVTERLAAAADPRSVELALYMAQDGTSPADWILSLFSNLLRLERANEAEVDLVVQCVEWFARRDRQPLGIREKAIEVLGYAESNATATATLMNLAGERGAPNEVRTAAAAALGTCLARGSPRGGEIVEALGEVLKSEGSPDVRIAAVPALGRAADPYWRDEREPELRAVCQAALKVLEAHVARENDETVAWVTREELGDLQATLGRWQEQQPEGEAQ